MFSSSARRVVFKAPQIPIVSLANSAPRAAAAAAPSSYRSHQRRFSSSKPSNPADGSKGVAKGQNLPATGPVDNAQVIADAQPEEKKSQRAGKRKARNVADSCAIKGRDKATNNLPSVPSTSHIAAGHLAASDFFSLYRPISLTHNFPKPVTEDVFASIFSNRPKPNLKPREVLSTLSNAISGLEKATGQSKQLNLGGPQQAQWNAETDELRAAITAESYRQAEAKATQQEVAMDFPNHILTGRYQPFHPPPPPMPMDTAESLAAGAEAAEILEPQHRRYKTVLTIDESTDEHGEVTYLAHSGPFHEDPVEPIRVREPTSFLERMQIRQERSRERAMERGMWAISVKRQRKLKMKKHKYKKLMRRTRNLRRRLDRN